ncbi:sensor histidine kinase [Streptomyces sp. NPDC048172]|uniref:sensor histidine kinase n=1 Tax=Streptomyces sp. NPDC048172 TaxID=3365505 RepID=UPI003723CB01
MTRADTSIDRRRHTFLRWHAYGLLGAATLLAAVSAPVMPGPADVIPTVTLVVAALALQLWWTRAARGRTGPSTAGAVYYTARWALGFALTWLNGFFSFYAASGYLDADELLRKRWRRVGPVACSVPVASAQAGGLPFSGPVQWGVFAGLLVANNVLLTIVAHFVEQEDERSQARAATIAELERTNAALQRALDENAALHAQLVVQAREAGVADERRRLAAEIHDTLAQGLIGIIAQLQVAMGTSEPAAAQQRLSRATELARHSLAEARRSVRNLAPMDLADDGLPQALHKTVAQWSAHTGVRAEFTLTGTAHELHGEVSATLLRIAQEALANASKHASASRVGVTLSFMDGEVTLDVRDDGRGFAPQAPPTGTGGFGLEGMRARAARVAGSLTVESEPGYGTAVSARVPLVRHEP